MEIKMTQDVVSKSQFATLIKVSRGRLSQMIKTGKVYGDAICGTGHLAKIRVAVAVGQLQRTVDSSVPNARLQLDGLAIAPNGDDQVLRADTSIDTDIKKQRLEQLSLSNDRARIEACAYNGCYTLTSDATRQMGRIGSQMINMFEGWLGELASAMAAKFSLPQRDVLHFLRSEFRAFRARSSENIRRQAQEIAEFVEEDLPKDDRGGDANEAAQQNAADVLPMIDAQPDKGDA
jgi:hypothetical protein